MLEGEQDSGQEDSSSNSGKSKRTAGFRGAGKSRPRLPKESNGLCASGSSSGSSSSSSWSSSSDSSFTLPTPPDGGWGWVVVLASFCANLIADGCAFSFGVLYVELLDYFSESRSKTALVGSLFISVPLITGPIASALTNKYGCRHTTIAGGFIAAIGFIASSQVRSIEMLCFTFGVVAGLGLALTYVPSLVIVAFYFEKKRAFATGLAVAGSGIGTFIFAPLIDHLIVEYSWHGALLILGGIMLNISLCGALFRPLVPQKIIWERHRQKSREKFSRNSSKISISGENQRGNNSPPVNTNGISFTLDHDVTYGPHPPYFLQDPDDPQQVSHSLIQFPTYLKKGPSRILLPLGATELDSRNDETVDVVQSESNLVSEAYMAHSVSALSVCKAVQDEEIGHLRENGHLGNGTVPKDTCSNGKANGHVKNSLSPVLKVKCNGAAKSHAKSDPAVAWQRQKRSKGGQLSEQYPPLYRKDIFYRGSLQRNRVILKGPPRAASCPDVFITSPGPQEGENTKPLLSLSMEVKLILHAMLDISILRSILFVYFCLHSLLLSISYDIPYMYTVDKAIGMGIPEARASFLVSIIGIVSTLGQIFSGFMGDQRRVNSLVFYNIMTMLAGVCTMAVPLLTKFESLATFCAMYGFFISANYALTTIIIVDLLDMERLTNAFGLVSLAEGIANLVGPPLAGYISDQTGSYTITFFVFGAIILLSGAMLFAIPCLKPYDSFSRSRSHSCSISSDSSSDSSSDESDVEQAKPKSKHQERKVQLKINSNVLSASTGIRDEDLNSGEITRKKIESSCDAPQESIV